MTNDDDHRPALRYDQRPADETPISTADLPPTPTRDRNIVATAWIELAPRERPAFDREVNDHAIEVDINAKGRACFVQGFAIAIDAGPRAFVR